jgi:hypothetical protein
MTLGSKAEGAPILPARTEVDLATARDAIPVVVNVGLESRAIPRAAISGPRAATLEHRKRQPSARQHPFCLHTSPGYVQQSKRLHRHCGAFCSHSHPLRH